jgi:hypothetical protein
MLPLFYKKGKTASFHILLLNLYFWVLNPPYEKADTFALFVVPVKYCSASTKVG